MLQMLPDLFGIKWPGEQTIRQNFHGRENGVVAAQQRAPLVLDTLHVDMRVTEDGPNRIQHLGRPRNEGCTAAVVCIREVRASSFVGQHPVLGLGQMH